MQMLPRECGSAVLYARGLRLRANGGLHAPVRPLLAPPVIAQVTLAPRRVRRCGGATECLHSSRGLLCVRSAEMPPRSWR
jgi:hypothetical protein